MTRKTLKKLTVLLATTALTGATVGCNTLDRLGEVGAAPRMTQPQNPTARPNYQPVSMPMPAPAAGATDRKPNSLWQTGSRAFFKDQRAGTVGDILTVFVKIDDKATLGNSSARTRANSKNASANAFLGYEASLHQILPEAVRPQALVDLNSTSNSNGAGNINRAEEVELKVAAVITQVLPNGNLVLQGRQEVRVNFELRELEIAGVVRPEDINSDNTISYEKIAEARIVYGGRGFASAVQQPPLGAQILDILFPF